MKTFHKWGVIVALLLAAFISYGYGFSTGAFIFIALGVIFEGAFWFKIFGYSNQADAIKDT